MITTVCMNPCYDKTATLSSLKPGEVNRLRDVRVDIGGKAINVAIVLRRLGVAADCIGCCRATRRPGGAWCRRGLRVSA